MKTSLKIFGFVSSLVLIVGCESAPKEDYILGAATQKNAQVQSVRDVNLPNSKAVESTSGVRAARAVKALNEGAMKDVSQTSSDIMSGGG
ncbi:MAG: hypothetical protein ACRBEQ_12770 [Hyphomonas sp.]